MEKQPEELNSKFGLVGKNIDYSFSRGHFTEKFRKEGLPYSYQNFDLDAITQFPSILKEHSDIRGLNVTIPYKEEVMPYLDEISETARKIGAVNTIKFLSSGKTKGYNTDYYGFEKSIKPFLQPHHSHALILGTGGASKAVAFTLEKLDISFHYVSRNPTAKATYTYSELTDTIIKDHPLIINCTPVGTHPQIDTCPDIPYDAITKEHLLYDLIYNPAQTKFLLCGEKQGATICNGADMLEYQAEKAWEIWNK